MNTANYTPGPWEHIGSYKAWFVQTVPDTTRGDVVTIHETTAIAEIRESDIPGQQRANARLIAAAPQLVDALEGFLRQYDLRHGKLTSGDTALAIAYFEARALLASIRGEGK